MKIFSLFAFLPAFCLSCLSALAETKPAAPIPEDDELLVVYFDETAQSVFETYGTYWVGRIDGKMSVIAHRFQPVIAYGGDLYIVQYHEVKNEGLACSCSRQWKTLPSEMRDELCPEGQKTLNHGDPLYQLSVQSLSDPSKAPIWKSYLAPQKFEDHSAGAYLSGMVGPYLQFSSCNAINDCTEKRVTCKGETVDLSKKKAIPLKSLGLEKLVPQKKLQAMKFPGSQSQKTSLESWSSIFLPSGPQILLEYGQKSSIRETGWSDHIVIQQMPLPDGQSALQPYLTPHPLLKESIGFLKVTAIGYSIAPRDKAMQRKLYEAFFPEEGAK